MREITTHHDGFGLAESIKITADDFGPGNASHCYIASIDGKEVARLQFQHGPRNEPGSTPGLTTAAALAMLIDHLQGFQSGEFRNRETAIALTHLEEAKLWIDHRTRERAARNVLGKYAK